MFNHEQILSLYRLRALPNGKYCVLEYKDPNNPKSAQMALNKTEVEVREDYRAKLGCSDDLIDERLRKAQSDLAERKSRA